MSVVYYRFLFSTYDKITRAKEKESIQFNFVEHLNTRGLKKHDISCPPGNNYEATSQKRFRSLLKR